MPLDKILEEWDKDATIDRLHPHHEITQIPILHAKYCKQLILHSVAVKTKRLDLDEIKRTKLLYYRGKLSKEELQEKKWEQWDMTVLKPDMDTFIDGDADVIAFKKKIALNEEAVNLCTAICKELTSRTYQIRSFMDWEKFKEGTK